MHLQSVSFQWGSPDLQQLRKHRGRLCNSNSDKRQAVTLHKAVVQRSDSLLFTGGMFSGDYAGGGGGMGKGGEGGVGSAGGLNKSFFGVCMRTVSAETYP